MSAPSRPPAVALAGFAVLALAGAAGAVLLAGRGRPATPAETPPPAFSRPTPTPTPLSPSPLPTYQPSTPGVSRADAIQAFLEVAPWPAEGSGPSRISRWERQPLLRLRGQPTAEDRACVARIVLDLTHILAGEAPVLREERGDLELYVLPKDQWTSVNPDARIDQRSALSLSGGGPGGLSRGHILIDRNLDAPSRCFQIRTRTTQAMGTFSWSRHPGTVVFAQESPDRDAKFSPLDREVLRLLYSPVLTSGLTVEEIRRRLE